MEDIIEEKVDVYGNRHWYKNGIVHREEDEPAYIGADGTRIWYKNGKFHREGDQPAIIRADGTRIWYKNSNRHREGDQPAIIWADGFQEWYKNGKRHRELGPAFNNSYFLEGIGYTREEWLLKVTALQRTVLAEWWEERYRWRNDLPERDGNQTLKLLGKLPRAALAEVLTQLSPVRD